MENSEKNLNLLRILIETVIRDFAKQVILIIMKFVNIKITGYKKKLKRRNKNGCVSN
jgi:hypothetical protein